MRPFLAALRFLTVFPVPGSLGTEERDLAGSVYWFPVVGLLLGSAAALLDYVLGFVLPPLPSSVLLVMALLFMSGGLHLDGLADTADAFFSSRPAGRMLEIMRDSRSGPMGTAAVACVLVLKIALLASVTGTLRTGIIVLMPVAGRCALLVMLSLLPYARPEGGLCSIFMMNRSRSRWIWALLFLLCAGWLIAGGTGLAAGISAFAAALALTGYTRRKIGGLTGDTLGAACEVAEIVPPLLAAIVIFRGGHP